MSCAHFGAYVMGTDIDYLLLHARGEYPGYKDDRFTNYHLNILSTHRLVPGHGVDRPSVTYLPSMQKGPGSSLRAKFARARSETFENAGAGAETFGLRLRFPV